MSYSREDLPFISIVIPTRNSGKTLRKLLESLEMQSYPKDKIEIIVVDGYSSDNTIRIAKDFGAKVIMNPARGFYTAKTIGALSAKGDLILYLDSDNVVHTSSWLLNMVEPFLKHNDVVASEALYYGYSISYPPIVRYLALIGSDDPVSVYLGYYGRYSFLKQRWTDIQLESKDYGKYILVTLRPGILPTMGANGFMIKSDVLLRLSIKPYFFDIDIPHELVSLGYNKIARVKVKVTHLHAFNYRDFIRKTYRRVRDFYIFHKKGMRRFKWINYDSYKLLKLILGVILIIPLISDSIKGYRRIRDKAWFLNWPLTATVTIIYFIYEILSGFYLIRQRISFHKVHKR
jgi:glycosyltransferase involved in cell wall biosynthesis